MHLDGEELGALDEDQRARLRAREGRLRLPIVPAHPHADRARERAGAARAPRRGRGDARRASCSTASASATGPTTIRRSSRAASSSGWPSPEHSAPARASSSPTSRPGNLDAGTGATIIDLMRELNRDLGTTLVLVTHDLDLARAGAADDPAGRRPAHRRQRRVSTIGFVLRMAAREIRAAPRRLLLLTGSVAIGVAALVAIDSSPTTCATPSAARRNRCSAPIWLCRAGGRSSARADGGARHARRAGRVSPGSRASPGWRTCRARAARGWCRSRRWSPDTRSTARSSPSPLPRGASCRPAAVSSSILRLLTALGARVGDTLALGDARFQIIGHHRERAGQYRLSCRVWPPGVHLLPHIWPRRSCWASGRERNTRRISSYPPESHRRHWPTDTEKSSGRNAFRSGRWPKIRTT